MWVRDWYDVANGFLVIVSGESGQYDLVGDRCGGKAKLGLTARVVLYAFQARRIARRIRNNMAGVCRGTR
jgi:hypothetical protein